MTDQDLRIVEISPIRCAIYGRTAAGFQPGDILNDQVQPCRRKADERGWQIVEDYICIDIGKSGSSMAGRAGLLRLLELAKSKPRPFEVLLVSSMSRLTRNLSDAFAIDDMLRRNGIHLYFLTEDRRSPIEGNIVPEIYPSHWIGKCAAVVNSLVARPCLFFGRAV